MQWHMLVTLLRAGCSDRYWGTVVLSSIPISEGELISAAQADRRDPHSLPAEYATAKAITHSSNDCCRIIFTMVRSVSQ